MRPRVWMVIVALAGFTLIAWAQRKEGAESAGSAAHYKVTPWPDHSANASYVEEVEQYLNQKAADGWRFHSEIASQGARMMIFERASR